MIFVKSQCDDCPFHKSSPLNGAVDWFVDIMNGWQRDSLEHTCHKTDSNADGYRGGSKKQCLGFLAQQKIENRCISSEALKALAGGEIDWSTIKTDRVYSLREMILAYSQKYQLFGPQKLRQIKRKLESAKRPEA